MPRASGHPLVELARNLILTLTMHPDIVNPTLGEHDIALLAEHSRKVSLRDGEPLFQAGEQRGGFFVVLEGAVEVLGMSDGEPRRVMLHGPGQFTGDVDVLTRRRTVVSAVARGDTTLLGVPSADVRQVMSERPRLGEVILRAFIARREELLESGFEGLRVVGSASSRDAFRVRQFLSRNQVPFTWIDVDADAAVMELLGHLGLAPEELPVVMAGDRPLLRNPSLRELADAVGLRRSPGPGTRDLVIIGAGPAGLGAAVYAASEGLDTVLLEADAPGGQAGTSALIENYLGFPTGISGAELTGRATLQAQKFGANISSPDLVTALELDGAHPVVVLDSGERATARCVLIATGADYRRLDVPRRELFDSAGVYYAATPIELAACEGSDVVVVGGGNSAGQGVMYLSEHTHHVWLLVRGGDLRRSMSSYLADRVEAAPNVTILHTTEIREMLGEARLEGVVVEDTRTGERRTIATPAVFSFIGAVPRTDWLPAGIETDPKGFVCTGAAAASSARWRLERAPSLLETTHPGVFAAGDVRLGSIPRVVSAVAEGAMVVRFVHEYLGG